MMDKMPIEPGTTIIEIDEDGKVTIPMKDCCRAAIQAENEACAELAKSMIGARPRQIAEAIRARDEEGEK